MNSDRNSELVFSEICRLCLSKEGVMLPIFEDSSKEDDLPLSSRIAMCASIQVSQGDGLPTLVCDRCVNHLDSWYTFKEQCRSSDATLRQYATSNAKITTRSEELARQENGPVLGRRAAEYGIGGSETLKRILLGGFGDMISESASGTCPKNVEDNNLLQYPWDCVSVELNENSDSVEESDEEEDVTDSKLDTENRSEKMAANTAGLRTGSCSTCGKSFRLGVYLQEHEASHVSEMKFFCRHCNKGFYTRAKLNVHARSHSLRHCNVCDKPFDKRCKLRKHLLTHGQDPGFLCFVCGKTFKSGEHLKSHVMAHLGERRHVCPTCGSAFKARKTLVTHIRTHTGDRPAICPVCGKAFRRKEAMTKHMRVHTGERPFTCPFCERAFSGKWNLTQHIRLHTGAKPYVCSDCGKAYTHNVTLRNHVKQIHEKARLITEVNV